MPHGGDPEEVGAFVTAVQIQDVALFTTPVALAKNGVMVSCPLGTNENLRVESIDIECYQAAIDGADPVMLVIEAVSAAGADVAALVSAQDIKSTTLTALVPLNIFTGSIVLTPGMSLVFRITVTTPTTAGSGYVLTVKGHILKV